MESGKYGILSVSYSNLIFFSWTIGKQITVETGSICVIISFPLMFIGCMGLCEHSNGFGYLIILIGLVCVFQFGWAAAQISHLAMIPELTHVEAERDELNIIRLEY